MTIRDFEKFLSENKLIKTHKLESLRNCRVGIDGAMWIKETVGRLVEEPFQLGIGGVPLTMNDVVIQDLEQWKHNGITPLIAFSGLNINLDRPPFFRNQSLNRKKAWEAYCNGNIDSAYTQFNSEKSVCLNFIRNLFPLLSERKIEYIQAPYLAWAQLAWFAKNDFIQNVFGGLELLMFGVQSVIISIDFATETYNMVELNDILQFTNMMPDQFIDSCILAGFDFCRTFFPLTKTSSVFSSALDMIKQRTSGAIAVQQGNGGASNLSQFLRIKYLIKNHIVLEPTCVCEPLNKDSAPSDLHEIFGFKFPIGIYFFLSQGVLNPQAVNLMQHGLIEAAPLVDSHEYRTALEKLIPLRSKTLAILSHALNEEFMRKPVYTIRWFDPDNQIEMDHANYMDLVDQLPCFLKLSDLDAEKSRQQRKVVDTRFLVDFLIHREKSASVAVNNNVILINPAQVSGQVLMHTMQYLEYISPDLKPSVYARALAGVSPEFQEEAIAIIELLRLGLLTSSPFSPTEDGGIESLYEKSPERFLIARVLSVLSADIKNVPWSGPLDQDLMAFNSILKALYRSLRNLIELLLMNLFVQNKAQILPVKFIAIANELPFFQESSTAMGLIVSEFLQKPQPSAKDLEQKFPGCVSPVSDLKRGIAFWGEISKMVKTISSSVEIDASIVNQFAAADRYLSEQCKLADYLN